MEEPNIDLVNKIFEEVNGEPYMKIVNELEREREGDENDEVLKKELSEKYKELLEDSKPLKLNPDELLRLYKIRRDCIIDDNTSIEDVKQVLRIVDPDDEEKTYEVLTIDDMSMVQGAAKSMKSTFNAILASFLLSGRNEGVQMFRSDFSPEEMKVLYIDTEQGKKYAKRTREYILNSCNDSQKKNLTYISLLGKDPSETLAYVEMFIDEYRPIFVILDGIVDACNNFLDAEESKRLNIIIKKFTTKYHCHMLNVLHTNPDPKSLGTKARGHLGTMLEQKCETVIELVKGKEEGTAIVNAKSTRGKPFKSFRILRADDYMGLMYNTENESTPSDKNSLTGKNEIIHNEIVEFLSVDRYGMKSTRELTEYVLRKAGLEVGEKDIKKYFRIAADNEWLDLVKGEDKEYIRAIYKDKGFTISPNDNFYKRHIEEEE